MITANCHHYTYLWSHTYSYHLYKQIKLRATYVKGHNGPERCTGFPNYHRSPSADILVEVEGVVIVTSDAWQHAKPK